MASELHILNVEETLPKQHQSKLGRVVLSTEFIATESTSQPANCGDEARPT
jgi:hypothetical protein